MSLHSRYPALSDLRARAQKRLPHFVWEFLDSGTGSERTKARNRSALDSILFLPSILNGEVKPDLRTRMLGTEYPLPFGIAPVGMSGLIWPRAEMILADCAAKAGIPYGLSTVASRTPEDVAPHLGEHGWFQLYPPRDKDIRRDMLRRVRDAGFETLVLTVDVPAASRRERQLRSGLTTPPRLNARLTAQVLQRPAWALATLREGTPRMRFIDDYTENSTGLSSTAHAGYLMRAAPDWDYLKALRSEWHGPLIIKGVMNPEDVAPLESEGVNGIWISNHAGRQFDASPATIEVLPQIRAATKLPIILDSGIETGLDILRAIALGADFVMLGRGFHYALAALGPAGPAHLIEILQQDLIANMSQIGSASLTNISKKLHPTRPNVANVEDFAAL